MIRRKAVATLGSGLGILAFTQLGGCGDKGTQAARTLSSSCSKEDLRLAKERDTISAACRGALASLLPKAEDDVAGRIRVAYRSDPKPGGAPTMGAATPAGSGATATLAMVGAPLSPLAAQDTIELSTDGGTTFASVPLGKPAKGTVALSVVTDYSGSMRSTDVALAERINARLWACVPSGTLSHVVAFSSEVRERKAFEDAADLSDSQGVDPSVPRKLTALHAALIASARALGKTDAQVRLLLAQTDGRENASKFTAAETTAALDDAGVVPILAGHFLADVPRAKALVKGRGFFLYAPALADLPENRVCSFLSSVRTLTVESAKPTADLRVRIDGRVYALEAAL